VKTGDVKIDAVLDQLDSGRIRVADHIRKEIDDFAGALDGIPEGVMEEDRQDTLAALRKIIDRVMVEHTAIADPFIESEMNEKFPFEDSQGNMVERETDGRGHVRERITATRTEVAERKTRQRQANEELAGIKELFKRLTSSRRQRRLRGAHRPKHSEPVAMNSAPKLAPANRLFVIQERRYRSQRTRSPATVKRRRRR
jgi:hypothetical protein